jgi:hypothetical protein
MPSPVSGRQNKRRKVASVRMKREGSPSNDEDDNDDDCQPENDVANGAEAEEDTEEEEDLGVMEVEDGDRDAPLLSPVSVSVSASASALASAPASASASASASAAASSTCGSPKAFLGICLPYVRPPDAPPTAPVPSSSQLSPEAHNDRNGNKGGQLPRVTTGRRGRLPSSAATSRYQEMYQGATLEASQSQAFKSPQAKASLEAFQHKTHQSKVLIRSCADSRTSFPDVPPNLGLSEDLSALLSQAESYVPVGPLVLALAVARSISLQAPDKEVCEKLVKALGDLIAQQVAGPILRSPRQGSME